MTKPSEITIKVPQEFKERLEKECSNRGTTKDHLIMKAVEHFLNTQEMQS